MQQTSHQFKANASAALLDETLRSALGGVQQGFVGNRAKVVALVPQWQQIRDDARALKDHVLEHLDHYLMLYEAQVQEQGGQVHWAGTPDEANRIILNICREAGARTVTKGKSMVSEEIGLNDALEAAGFDTVETDLGEYILQLAQEAPSHIIAPAIHKTREQVASLFREHHQRDDQAHGHNDRAALVAEARRVLREKFLAADVGITGANFLVAETGQHVLVTNEGNGDLTSNLPGVQIVLAGIEKVVPTLEDAACMLRLLARSATGQKFSNYTSLMSGPRRAGEHDGPGQFHVVLVDNRRSEMLGSALREMLRCIRCGACMNHCPVYGAVGGHSYGWVYPGPMGSVLTPAMTGIENSYELPHACTLNGRCAEVCPMSIPLPQLLREHRRDAFEKQLGSARARWALQAWAKLAIKPRLYRLVSALMSACLSRAAGKQGYLKRLPLASGWTAVRHMPAPAATTFMQQYRQHMRSAHRTALHAGTATIDGKGNSDD